jgi:hypothetical protein
MGGWSDPTPALIRIRESMKPTAEAPSASHIQRIQERDAATAAARDKLTSHPLTTRDEFEKLLAAAPFGSRIQEDHNFWIDQNGLPFLRRVFLEIGKRLAVRGGIESAGDFAYLVPDQIREAMTSGQSYIAMVENEKVEMARWANVTAPPTIGTDHDAPPPSMMGRAMGRFFGAPPPQTGNALEVTGIPVLAGAVRGTTRLIMNLRDADRL